MSAKYQVSKQYSRLTGENQWTLTCHECGQKRWVRDWKTAIFLASYPCEPCALWEMLKISLVAKPNTPGANHA